MGQLSSIGVHGEGVTEGPTYSVSTNSLMKRMSAQRNSTGFRWILSGREVLDGDITLRQSIPKALLNTNVYPNRLFTAVAVKLS